MREIGLKIANSVCSKMLRLQVTCETPINVSRYIRAFQFHGCARSKPQFVTAVPSLKLFRSMQVYEWTVYQRFNSGNVSWKQYYNKPGNGNFQRERVMCFFLSQLTMSRPTFPTLGLVIGRVSLDNSLLIKHVRTSWQIRQPYDSSDVHCFSNFCLAPLSLYPRRWCKRWRKQNALTKCGINIHTKNVEIKVASWCDEFLWMSLRNHGFEDTQCKRDFLPGLLYHMKSGGQPFADWFTVSNLATHEGLWDIWPNRRRVVENARKFTSSHILFYVWESRRWLRQKLSSPKDGKTISSTTNTPQRELMERQSNIHSTYLLAKDEWDYAQHRRMDSKRSRRWLTTVYSRDLPTASSSHGND